MDEPTPIPDEPAEGSPSQHAPLPFANPVAGDEAAGSNGPRAPFSHEVPLATFGRRMLGYLLDGLILFVPAIVIGAILGNTTSGGWVANLLGLAIGFVYVFWFIAKKEGQTIGMKALKLRCVRATDGGVVDTSISARRAAYAAAFSFVSLFIFIPILIDLLWPLWDKKNQTLHDILARTVVIDVRAQTHPNTIVF